MSDEPTDLTELKDAVRAGLRKCRHEEAPIPIIRDADLFHITHMVATEVAAAGFSPVRSEHSPGETCAEADERAADNWARAESAEAALAGLRKGKDAATSALAELVALKDGPRGADYERRKPLAWQVARHVLAAYAPTPDREEARDE